MKPGNLLVRCYAEKKDGYWFGICLDFDIAVQGDSVKEVQKKLNSMVGEYVYDALAGDDQQYKRALLSRRAPKRYWLKYYTVKALHSFDKFHNGMRVLFKVPVVNRYCT